MCFTSTNPDSSAGSSCDFPKTAPVPPLLGKGGAIGCAVPPPGLKARGERGSATGSVGAPPSPGHAAPAARPPARPARPARPVPGARPGQGHESERGGARSARCRRGERHGQRRPELARRQPPAPGRGAGGAGSAPPAAALSRGRPCSPPKTLPRTASPAPPPFLPPPPASERAPGPAERSNKRPVPTPRARSPASVPGLVGAQHRPLPGASTLGDGGATPEPGGRRPGGPRVSIPRGSPSEHPPGVPE